MKEITAIIAPVLIILTLIWGIAVLVYQVQKYEDNYCLTTPLERIDRDRCGLGEDK